MDPGRLQTPPVRPKRSVGGNPEPRTPNSEPLNPMELYEEPIAVLTMLARVAKINGVIDEPERRLIEGMAKKMMVPQDMVNAIIEGRVTAEINPPDEEWERIPYFQMCVMMTGVNGEFDDKEAIFCKRLGDSQPQAIAPFDDFGPHCGLLVYTKSIHSTL